MEQINKNEKSFFSNTELEKLKGALPGRYYKSFKAIWARRYKSKDAPSTQNISAILKGKAENDAILGVLVELVEERKVLKERLNQVTRVAEQETAAVD